MSIFEKVIGNLEYFSDICKQRGGNMMKKRLISLTLAGCMIAMSLAGCGGGSTDGETTTAGTNAGGETTASSVQAAEGDTILKWAVWDILSAINRCL